MRLRVLKSFKDKLNDQIEYVAKDKPEAARRFKKEVLQRIGEIPQMPYSNRKSIFFDREDIRDMVYKGYIIVYRIDKNNLLSMVKYGVQKTHPVIRIQTEQPGG